MKGIQSHLEISLCKDSDEAVEKGYVYRTEDGWRGVNVDKVVIVAKGTQSGNATLDLQMSDDADNKTVVSMTVALLAGALRPFDPLAHSAVIAVDITDAGLQHKFEECYKGQMPLDKNENGAYINLTTHAMYTGFVAGINVALNAANQKVPVVNNVVGSPH